MNPIRRARPQVNDDDSDVEEYRTSRAPKHGTHYSNSASHDEDEEISDARSDSEAEEQDEGEEESEEDEEVEEDNSRTVLSQISFAALAKAQASLAKTQRKAGRAESSQKKPITHSDNHQKFANKKEKESHSRVSKNAPQEISSKRAVTRKREVVEPITRQKARDPRFDTAVNSRYDEHLFRKNYSFLEDYRNNEMRMLKEEIKKTKDERKSEQLAKKLKSMESQKQSQQNKDRLQQVLREHKKKERELVKQGKKPFYPKESTLKRLVLEDRYSELSEKQLESTIARKQKRKTQKERKNMPWARREV